MNKRPYVLCYNGVPDCWHVKPEDAPTDPTVADLQNLVFEFAEETFGGKREDAAWKKLFEEIGETLKNPQDPLEWADVFIILLDLAAIYKIDVGAATLAKMAINRDRVWTTAGTGVMQHVHGAVKPPQRYTHDGIFNGGPYHGSTSFETPIPDEIPTAFAPPSDLPGCYVLDRKDRGMGGRVVYVYNWDPEMEAPF